MEKHYRSDSHLADQREREREREPVRPICTPGKRTLTHHRSTRGHPAAPGKMSLTSRVALIQRHSTTDNASRAHDMLDRIRDALELASHSSGQPLPETVQKELETLTRTDLSAVRVHTDAAADQAARAVDADAFATGQHVYFAAGKYEPGSERGRRLLAHEVAHTLQQRHMPAWGTSTATISSPGDPLEKQADEFGGLFASAPTAHQRVRLDAAPSPQVQRQLEGPEQTSEGTPAGDESVQPTADDAPEETYVTHELIGYQLRPGATLADFPAHIRRMVRGLPTGRRLREAVRVHQDRGHRIIRQVRFPSEEVRDKRIVLSYAAIPHTEPTVSEESLSVNDVAVPVRGATSAELASVREALSLVPGPHLQVFLRSRHRIVIVDWSGSRRESSATHRLTGGVNIDRTITRAERPHQSAEAEEGLRVEITHTAMAQEDGGITTILHEMGHVMYDAGLIPRVVDTDYGTSVHAGASEQPAYAYMYYVWRPDRLRPSDRRAFDAAFRRQELAPSRSSGAASEGAADEPESSE